MTAGLPTAGGLTWFARSSRKFKPYDFTAKANLCSADGPALNYVKTPIQHENQLYGHA